MLLSLQEMLHFARGRSPGKMLKALATGRFPGAESPANLLIANEPTRALAPGKFAGFCRLCQHHISHFQTMPGTLHGLTPGKMCTIFFCKKKVF